MKKVQLKRWMLGASAMMVLASAEGCSLQKNKCQENHFDMTTIEMMKAKDNRRPYLERGTMIPMETGDVCVEEKDLKNAIREKFYSTHSLIDEGWKDQNPSHIETDEYAVFDKIEQGINQNGKIICDDTLREIEDDKTTLDFVDYIVSLEETKQEKAFFSDEEIAEMFTIIGGYYQIESEKDNEKYQFKILEDNKEHKERPYEEGSFESVVQTIENDSFEIEKGEKIMASPLGSLSNERVYSVNQYYKLTFFDEKNSSDINLVLDQTWEIKNRDIVPDAKYECRNYNGSFSLQYKDEKQKAEITEEQYDVLAEEMVKPMQNKNTWSEFVEENNEVLIEYFQLDDTISGGKNKNLVRKK